MNLIFQLKANNLLNLVLALLIQLKFQNYSRRNYYSELSFVIICVNEKVKKKKRREREYGRDGNGGTEIVIEKYLNYNEDVTTDTV